MERHLFSWPYIDHLWICGGFTYSGASSLQWLADQFGLSFLKFLTVEIRCSLFYLGFNLFYPCRDSGVLAFTFNNSCIVFVGGYATGATQVFDSN